MKVEKFSTPVKGIGKPDYSRAIALGRTRPGFSLKYGETLSYLGVALSDIVSPFPFVQPPLAAGGTIRLIDGETFLPTPYTIPVGYTWSIFQIGYGLNQDSRLQAYLDGDYYGQLTLGIGGAAYILTEIAAFSSKLFDSAAESSHEVDFILENMGGADMEGSVSIWAILEAVGTNPLSKDKTIKCKNCGKERLVPKETTRAVCPCGYETFYYDLSRVRGL